MRSAVSDQCYFYAKYNKNASTRTCLLKFLGKQNNPLRECNQVCSYNFFFYNLCFTDRMMLLPDAFTFVSQAHMALHLG